MTAPHFVPHSDADSLALEISTAFGDTLNLAKYRRVCATHERSVVYAIYREVMDTPREKIKKSRPAYFFYLIYDYDTR